MLGSGDVDGAVRALANADAVRTRLGTPPWTAFRQVVEPRVATARAQLTPIAFQRQWDAGRRMDPFSLLDTALARLPSREPTSGASRDAKPPHAPARE